MAGELDMATAPLLRQALDGDASTIVCVDMSGVPFMDSAGAHELLRRARGLGDDGCMIIHAPQPNVARVFHLLGLTQDVRNLHLLDGHGGP